MYAKTGTDTEGKISYQEHCAFSTKVVHLVQRMAKVLVYHNEQKEYQRCFKTNHFGKQCE